MQNLKNNEVDNDTEVNEFMEVFNNILNDINEDIEDVKEMLINFFYNLNVGIFTEELTIVIEFLVDEFTITIPKHMNSRERIMSTPYETYGVKVINKALQKAYKLPYFQELNWDFKEHRGELIIQPLF